jgi:hypothetical protein
MHGSMNVKNKLILFCFENRQFGDRFNSKWLQNLPEIKTVRDQINLIIDKGNGLLVTSHAAIDGNKGIDCTHS